LSGIWPTVACSSASSHELVSRADLQYDIFTFQHMVVTCQYISKPTRVLIWIIPLHQHIFFVAKNNYVFTITDFANSAYKKRGPSQINNITPNKKYDPKYVDDHHFITDISNFDVV
jgi:hypothetical protein